jgi:hypothetical protein
MLVYSPAIVTMHSLLQPMFPWHQQEFDRAEKQELVIAAIAEAVVATAVGIAMAK